MDENVNKRNEVLAQTVINGLQSRNMSGYYAEDKEAALKQALELIDEESTIAMGGCHSAQEIGLVEALKEGNYNYIDRSKMTPREGLLASYDADVFLSSANAMTSDGILVNIDGNSNRVSCIAQGPKKVIFIVGMNKVCSDLDSAMKRARKIQKFLSQPFHVAENFTGIKGKYVPLKETIRGFKAIVDGEMDQYPENAFFNVGTIEDVIEKAKTEMGQE